MFYIPTIHHICQQTVLIKSSKNIIGGGRGFGARTSEDFTVGGTGFGDGASSRVDSRGGQREAGPVLFLPRGKSCHSLVSCFVCVQNYSPSEPIIKLLFRREKVKPRIYARVQRLNFVNFFLFPLVCGAYRQEACVQHGNLCSYFLKISSHFFSGAGTNFGGQGSDSSSGVRIHSLHKKFHYCASQRRLAYKLYSNLPP